MRKRKREESIVVVLRDSVASSPPSVKKKKKTFGRLSFRVPSLSKPRLLPLGFVVVVVVARY